MEKVKAYATHEAGGALKAFEYELPSIGFKIL